MVGSQRRSAVVLAALAVLALSCGGDGVPASAPSRDTPPASELPSEQDLPPEPELLPEPELSPAAEPLSEQELPTEPEPIKFGFLSGLSGDYADWGPRSLDSARAAIGEINANGGVLGREVELVVEDSQSTAHGSLAGYYRIREEIHALGGLESDGAVALLGALATDQMPTMCPICGTTELDTRGGNYLWRLAISHTAIGVVVAQLARDLGHRRVALLVHAAPGQDWLDAVADAFRGTWEGAVGGEITADVRFAPGFGSSAAEVRHALRDNPEAVFLLAGRREGASVLREVIDSGYEGTMLLSTDLLIDEVAEVAADLPTGRVLGTWVADDIESPGYRAFVAAHIEHAGKPPSSSFPEANQYDQYIALALAMTAAGSTDGPAVAAQVPRVLSPPGTDVYSYADGVAALERGEDINYDGASSSLDLNKDGNLTSPTVKVAHIVDGLWSERWAIQLDPALDLHIPPRPRRDGPARSIESDSADGPVRFGFLSGLSGDYAAWGPSSLDGAKAAIGEINANGGVLGRPLELVVEDNLSTAEGSVAGYDRIRGEIHALGGLESDGAVALLNTVAEDEMPTMCPVCGTTVLDTTAGNFLWRITASDSTYGVMFAQMARDLGYTRVAVLAQRTWIFEREADSFRDVWETAVGGEITADVRFDPKIGIQMAEVVQAFEGDPEAVYVGGPTEAGMSILREYIDRGYDATILISLELIGAEIANTAARLPTGRVLGAWVTDDYDSPAYSTFASAHREYAGKPPPTGLLEANQYDQYIALALAMTAAGSTDGPAVAEQVPRVLNRARHQGVQLRRRCRGAGARRGHRLRRRFEFAPTEPVREPDHSDVQRAAHRRRMVCRAPGRRTRSHPEPAGAASTSRGVGSDVFGERVCRGAGSVRVPERLVRGLFLGLGPCQPRRGTSRHR